MLLLALLLQEGTIYGTVDADAAPIYQSFEAPKIPDVVLNYLDGKSKPEELRAALAPFEGILEKLAHAARAKRCAWSYAGRESYAGVVPLDCAIAAARLFSARAWLRLESGDVEGALDDVAASWGVGIHYLSDGPVLPALGGLIAVMLVEGSLQYKAPGRAFSSTHLRRLALHAEAVGAAIPPFRRIMEGEKRVALGGVDEAIQDMGGLMTRLERAGKKPPEEKKASKGEPGEAMWKRLQELLQNDRAAARRILRRRVEEVWENILQDAEQPIDSTAFKPDYESLRTRSATRWTQYERDGDPQQGLEAAADLYVLLVAPALDKAKANVEKVRLSLNLRALWCRVELAERESGEYPESIERLKPPVDLWDGQPVKYRRFEEKGRRGFVLTAIGPNKDWEERLRRLAELDFDLDKFEAALGDGLKTAPPILWQVRR